MKARSYHLIALESLSRRLSQVDPVVLERPHGGWIRAIRQALGLTYAKVAAAAGTSAQSIASYEKSEAADAITLASLQKCADVMGCRLVYAFVPKEGNLETLAAQLDPSTAVREAVAHTMVLENQAVPPAKPQE